MHLFICLFVTDFIRKSRLIIGILTGLIPMSPRTIVIWEIANSSDRICGVLFKKRRTPDNLWKGTGYRVMTETMLKVGLKSIQSTSALGVNRSSGTWRLLCILDNLCRIIMKPIADVLFLMIFTFFFFFFEGGG